MGWAVSSQASALVRGLRHETGKLPARRPGMASLCIARSRIRWSGRSHGHDTREVLDEIGVTPEQLAQLRERGIV